MTPWLLALLGIALVVTALRILLFRGPLAPPQEPPRGIVDMHCHTAGVGTCGSGAWVSDAMRASWKFDLYLKIFGSSRKAIAALGDASLVEIIARQIRAARSVDAAVILAMDAPRDAAGEIDWDACEVYVPNRFVAEAVRPYPELHFGASVHPSRADALEELAWSKANGAVLLKWLPNIQNIDPADARLRPFYAKLVELDLPLLTHVGDEESFSRTNNALADPRRLILPLECGVRVIAAHVASSGFNDGEENIERLLALMPLYPNLFADISTLTQFNRKRHLPKVLADARLRGRLLYGTDYPLTNTPMVSPLLFWRNLTLAQLWRLCRIRNSWDRDVALKAALGVPPDVFAASRSFLGL